MSPGSSSGAENSIAAGRKCGCGSVCWLCYSWNNNNNNNTNNTNNNGGGLAYAANQLHSSSLHLQLSDQAAAPLAHHPAGESNGGGAATLLAAGDSSRGGWQEPETFSQQTKSSTGAAAVIRPLRSWSSSEKRGPSLEEPPRSRGPRRFSAAGPPPLAAAGPGGTNNSSTGSTSSAKSAVGSQRSHVLASLHTWAEEEDELADGAMGAALVHSRASTGSSRLFQQAHGHAEYTRTQSTRYMHRQQHSSGSIGTSTTNGGSRFVVRHNVPEPTFGFVEVGSSSGSSTGSGGPLPPSSVLAAGAGNAAAATAATAAARNTNHQRLRTPYSISIPSIIGSPLSFTQPFLATASRTSMFGRQPPSSQIRAAHIDWDSLSMAEELLGASACGGGNRNGSSNSAAAGCGGDLHLWQQGAAIDHLSFVGSANGGCGFGALQPAADRSAKNGAIHGVAGGQPGFPQRTIDPLVGPGAGLDHQNRLANYYYQQYLLQSQMHMLPPHLQSAVRQQQLLLQQQFLRQMQQAPHPQQHQQQPQQPQQQQIPQQQNQNQNQQQHNQQQKTNQQQQMQRQSQSQPLPQSQKQLQNQRPLHHHQHPQLTHQHQNELFPEFSPGHMAYPPAPGAVGTAVLAGIHSGGTGISGGGNPGGLIQQPHAAIGEAYEAAMAQLTLASALEKQMTWEYACQRHPVISGFAVAAPLRLSTAWRWGLLCLVLASAGCVLVGTPVALMVLLAHQDTIFLAANPF